MPYFSKIEVSFLLPSVFTLFGELKADTNSFQQSLRAAEARLESTEHAIAQTEAKSQQLGKTNAVTARSFEKMREKTAETERKLKDAVNAFNKGEMSAKQFARSIQAAERSFTGLNSRVKDTTARLSDFANKNKGMGFGATLTGANLAANAISMVTAELKEFIVEGFKLNMSLDKLARYVGTVDDSLKNIDNLKKFKAELQDLSTRLPFTAEEFAKASYTISSGLKVFGDDRIQVLEKLAKGAAAANIPVNELADNVTGLLVAYKVPIKEIDNVMASLNSSIGKAIVTDAEFLTGLNKLAPQAQQTGQSLQTLLVTMGVMTKDTKDGAMAFTNLQNVLNKIFDPQYEKGLKDIFHTSFFDAQGNVKQLNVLIQDLAKELQGLTKEQQIAKLGEVFKDAQARAGILSLISNIDELNKAMADSSNMERYKQNTDIMLTSTEARWKQATANWENTQRDFWDKFTDFMESASMNTTPNIGTGSYTQIAAGIVGAFMKGAEQAKPQVKSSGLATGNVFVESTSNALNAGKPEIFQTVNSMTKVDPSGAKQSGFSVGSNLGQGVVDGIQSKQQSVWSAAQDMVSTALGIMRMSGVIRSPSAITTYYGEMIGEGLAVGMENKTKRVVDASAGLIKKSLAEMQKQLKELTGENQATIGGYSQTIGTRSGIFDAEKIKSQLNDLIALRLELGLHVNEPLIVGNLEREIAGLTTLKDRVGDVADKVKDVLAERNKGNEIANLFNLFADPDTTKLINDRAKALGLTAEAFKNIAVNAARADIIKQLGEGLGMPEGWGDFGEREEGGALGSGLAIPLDIMDQPPELKARWTDFFATLRAGLAEMKASLPTIKTAIGENLLNSIYQIGDVFGNALNQWSSRSQGFFSALAQGFRQLISGIISELIRLMVMKAVLNIVGMFAGGAAGGSGGGLAPDIHTGAISGGSPVPGFARGGFTGTGSISDLAGVVHKNEFVMPFEAVRKFGRGFMENIRNLQFPQPAYAGGFMPSSSTTNNNQRSSVFNITVSGGGSREQNFQTAQMIKREVIAGLRKEEQRNK